MPYVSGNVGAVGPFAGTYLPVADATGVTVDTTTYDDTIKGSGKLTTLVFPENAGSLAIALAGDAFPRWVLAADPNIYGLTASVGTVDTPNQGASLGINGAGTWNMGAVIIGDPPTDPLNAASIGLVSPYLSITSGALPTQQLVSTTGAQIITTRDAETVTPVTFNPTAGAAATCVVAISSDNTTYSTVGTETEPAGVALDGTVHLLRVRVPAGWYLKMTTTNATLGLTTKY